MAVPPMQYLRTVAAPLHCSATHLSCCDARRSSPAAFSASSCSASLACASSEALALRCAAASSTLCCLC